MNIDFLTKCSDIFYKLSSSEEEYGPELTEISAGTILYHGTSGEDDFIYPDGPAWFSDSEKVAMNILQGNWLSACVTNLMVGTFQIIIRKAQIRLFVILNIV